MGRGGKGRQNNVEQNYSDDFKGGYKGHGKGKNRSLPTLPAVTEHMDALLALPDDMQAALSNCIAYEYTMDHPSPALPPADDPTTTIFGTVEMDSFQAAAALLSEGWPRPAVLNMANEHNCGGAWCQKPGSQEEDLLRCSSLPLSLWPRRLPSDHRMPEYDDRLPRSKTIYPFTEAGVMYSPNVLVCRSREGTPYESRDHIMVSVITSAAQDLRENRPHYKGPFNRHLTREKLRSHLWAAVYHGHRALVLGAFGCGAFRNEPDPMTKLYMQLLGPGGEFEGRFDVVLFAIIKSRYLLDSFSAVFPWTRRVPRPQKGKGKGRGTGELTAAASTQPMLPTAEVSNLTPDEKEVLKLAKKLREIAKLEERIAAGEVIAANQQAKLDSKDECARNISKLLASLPADSDVIAKVQDVV